jgi:hypothetical protein
MTSSIVIEYFVLFYYRSKTQASLETDVQATRASSRSSMVESTLTLVVDGLSSLPTMPGTSVVSFVWISTGIIVASTVVALVYTPESSHSSPDEESGSRGDESPNTDIELFHDRRDG